jgi:hypothetical protein
MASTRSRIAISKTANTHRALTSSDKTYQSTDVSDEIPEFLTSLRTSTIYTLEKVGKETVATIVASPAISEHEFCKPALTAQSARHRAGTAGNTEVRSRSGESVKRFFRRRNRRR